MATNKVIELTDANFESTLEGSTNPVIIDFWAPWCGPCKQLAPFLEELAAEYDGRVTVAKVNVDHNQAVSGAYDIRSLPTLVVVKNGEMVQRQVGFSGKAGLEKLFKAAL